MCVYFAHRCAANIRQIRGRYADQYTWIYGGYTADIRGYTRIYGKYANTRSSRKFAEIRGWVFTFAANTRKYASKFAQIRTNTRAYTRIRDEIHTDSQRFAANTQTFAQVHRDVSAYELGHVSPHIDLLRPLSWPAATEAPRCLLQVINVLGCRYQRKSTS